MTLLVLLVLTAIAAFSYSLPIGGNLEKCQTDTLLDPKLLCRMEDLISRKQYSEDQNYCICPAFTECKRRTTVIPETDEKIHKFLCEKPKKKVKELEDMTEGLLVDHVVEETTKRPWKEERGQENVEGGDGVIVEEGEEAGPHLAPAVKLPHQIDNGMFVKYLSSPEKEEVVMAKDLVKIE